MGRYSIVGVYSVTPTLESIRAAARYHGYDWLLDEHGDYIDKVTWEDHSNLGLVEMEVSGQYSPDELMEIHHGDQALYMEFYLDAAGTHLLSEEEAMRVGDRRLCFFMHFVDTNRPLMVGGEAIELPSMTQLPGRLVPFAHYLPVD